MRSFVEDFVVGLVRVLFVGALALGYLHYAGVIAPPPEVVGNFNTAASLDTSQVVWGPKS